MANTPWLSRNWVAVNAPAGDEVSSAVTIWILRPLIPPALLTASKYALAPLSAVENVEDAAPVLEVMNPTFTVVAVTPGALALLAAPDEEPLEADPVAAVVAGAWPVAAVVGVEELFDELLHAAAVNATAANTTAAPRTDQDL